MTITPRVLHFFSTQKSQYWLGNCPIKTLFANAMSVFIPYIEKFFIASVRACSHDLSLDALKEDVKHFIQQEANHSREYSKYVNDYIINFYPGLDNMRFPLMGFVVKYSSPKMRLAMTAAGEHFTAVLSTLLLKNPTLLEEAPSSVKELWHWHCVEEIEHRAVAFDVLQHQSSSYFLRATGFLIMTLFTLYAFSRVYWHMMKHDGLYLKWRFYKASILFFFIKPGYFGKIKKAYWRYLWKNFHPKQI